MSYLCVKARAIDDMKKFRVFSCQRLISSSYSDDECEPVKRGFFDTRASAPLLYQNIIFMFSSTPPLNSETKLKEEKEGIFFQLEEGSRGENTLH